MSFKKAVANSKYIGLPLHIQKAKAKSFRPILEKVEGKLSF